MWAFGDRKGLCQALRVAQGLGPPLLHQASSIGRGESQPSPVPDRAGLLTGSAAGGWAGVRLGAMPFRGHGQAHGICRLIPSWNFLTATCACPGISTVNSYPIFISNPRSFQCPPGYHTERRKPSLPSPHYGGFLPLISYEIN